MLLRCELAGVKGLANAGCTSGRIGGRLNTRSDHLDRPRFCIRVSTLRNWHAVCEKCAAWEGRPIFEQAEGVQQCEPFSVFSQYPFLDYMAYATRDAAYYLHSAHTFDAHAKDHAQILSRYSADGQPVPKKIVEEQTAAIRNNVESAAKDFDSLKVVSKNDPDLAKAVAELERRLAQIEQSRAKLQDTCEEMSNAAGTGGKTSPATMLKCCATMQKEIQTLMRATGAVFDRFQQENEVQRQLDELQKRTAD